MFRMHRLILQGCKKQSDDFKTHTCKSQGSKVHDEFFFRTFFFFLFIIFSLSSELSAFWLLIHLRNNQKVSMHLNCFVQHGIRKVFPVQLP